MWGKNNFTKSSAGKNISTVRTRKKRRKDRGRVVRKVVTEGRKDKGKVITEERKDKGKVITEGRKAGYNGRREGWREGYNGRKK